MLIQGDCVAAVPLSDWLATPAIWFRVAEAPVFDSRFPKNYLSPRSIRSTALFPDRATCYRFSAFFPIAGNFVPPRLFDT
jgi:hypothetical protein